MKYTGLVSIFLILIIGFLLHCSIVDTDKQFFPGFCSVVNNNKNSLKENISTFIYERKENIETEWEKDKDTLIDQAKEVAGSFWEGLTDFISKEKDFEETSEEDKEGKELEKEK